MSRSISRPLDLVGVTDPLYIVFPINVFVLAPICGVLVLVFFIVVLGVDVLSFVCCFIGATLPLFLCC